MPLIRFLEKPIGMGSTIIDKYNEDPDVMFEFKLFENIIGENGEFMNPPLIKPDKKTDEWKPGDEGELLNMKQDGYIKFIVCDYLWKDELMPEANPYKE